MASAVGDAGSFGTLRVFASFRAIELTGSYRLYVSGKAFKPADRLGIFRQTKESDLAAGSFAKRKQGLRKTVQQTLNHRNSESETLSQAFQT